MVYAHARFADHRHDEEQYPESYGPERQREREYYAGERGGRHPSDYPANYPQYGAADSRHRHSNDEYYSPRRGYAGPRSRPESDYRYGALPHAVPDFGRDEVTQHNYFGYPESERRPHDFSLYDQMSGGPHGLPEPGYFDRDYLEAGSPGFGPGHPDYSRQLHGNRHDQHVDPEYRQWREEQIRNLDRDYEEWRRERYHKFSCDFDSWRRARPQGEKPDAPVATASSGTGKDTSAVSSLNSGKTSPGTK